MLLSALVVFVSACGGGGSGTDATSSGESANSGSPASEEGTGGPTVLTGKIGELAFDPKKVCGTKPMKVGLLYGTQQGWRQSVKRIEENLLKECPNVTDVKYVEPEGDPEKYNTTLSTWAAEGVNVINSIPELGQATVPAFRAAQQAGAIVTSNSLVIEAMIPTDVSGNVEQHQQSNGELIAGFLGRVAKEKGKKLQVIQIGGPASNTFDPPFNQALREGIEKEGANAEFVGPEFVVGDWEAGKTQQATASILAKYPNIDVIVMSLPALAGSVFRAYEAAGKPVPDITGAGPGNEFVCLGRKLREGAQPDYQFSGVVGGGNVPAIALAQGMAIYQGIEDPEIGIPNNGEPTQVELPLGIDSTEGKIPKCDPTVSGEAESAMALTHSELEELFPAG